VTIIEIMRIQLDCYYSLSSPWMYFAGPQLQDVVRRHQARLVLKPYDFQAVVPVTGGIPLKTRPEPSSRRSTFPLPAGRCQRLRLTATRRSTCWWPAPACAARRRASRCCARASPTSA
jgi:2-hydroxychromene-2-carboxylate isomerase